MGFSIGFVNFTVSVLKSALAIIDSHTDENLKSESLGDNLKLTEGKVAEIIDRTTNIILEKQVNQLKDLESELVLEIGQTNATELSEIQGTIKNDNHSEVDLKQFPNDQSKILSGSKDDESLYETHTRTEYFLMYHYDINDYSKFKQKIQRVERKLQTDEELNADHEKNQKLREKAEITRRSEKLREITWQNQQEENKKTMLIRRRGIFEEK